MSIHNCFKKSKEMKEFNDFKISKNNTYQNKLHIKTRGFFSSKSKMGKYRAFKYYLVEAMSSYG